MGKQLDRAGEAERLLSLHNEWDALDKKENLGVLSLILFVIALVLMAMGIETGSVYLDVNGLFMAIAGVVVGGLEVSKRRRMRGLRRKIERIEEGKLEEGAGVERDLLDPPG